jgi:hypothetical protein
MKRLLLVPVVLIFGCGTGTPRQETREVSPGQLERLRIMEVNLPVAPDSVAELYKRYDPVTFYSTYGAYVSAAARLVDSLNRGFPDSLRIDTLAIDHAFENIGVAAHQGKSIFLSSSYFYLYDDSTILRSVIFHEFGHLYYRVLTQHQLQRLTQVWLDLHEPSAFYLFRDREYSHNSKFGGHPDDSPAELFASAFNLLRNNAHAILIRSWLLPADQRATLDRLRDLVKEVTGQPVEGEEPGQE